jgi:hypothetical protein
MLREGTKLCQDKIYVFNVSLINLFIPILSSISYCLIYVYQKRKENTVRYNINFANVPTLEIGFSYTSLLATFKPFWL